MKRISLLLFIVSLMSCQSDKRIKPAEPDTCSDTKYIRVKELNNIETIVLAKTYSTANGSATKYYIDQPDAVGFMIPWVACNLPEPFKKDKLAVRISGYTLTYPGMEKENSDGNPIELTRIEAK